MSDKSKQETENTRPAADTVNAAGSGPHTGPEKPRIFVFCDSSLSPEDRAILSSAVSELETLFPMCKTENMDCVPRAEKDRQTPDSFLEGTFNGELQADATLVLRKLESAYKTLPNAAAAVLFTGRGLFLSSLNLRWCFGAASHGRRVSVQTVLYYRDLSAAEKARCIRRTLRHEVGHIFGMAWDLKRICTEDRGGHHCTSEGCSMRQAGTLRVLLEHSLEEDRLGTYFCRHCRQDLERHFAQGRSGNPA